jgi:hypothetical protein
MISTYCSEVLSLAPTPGAQSESGDLSDVNTGGPLPQVKVLLIAQRVDGFFLERFTDHGELVGTTQHETLDEAMWQAYSEYDAISDWRFCPDDADPLEYIRAQSDP